MNDVWIFELNNAEKLHDKRDFHTFRNISAKIWIEFDMILKRKKILFSNCIRQWWLIVINMDGISKHLKNFHTKLFYCILTTFFPLFESKFDEVVTASNGKIDSMRSWIFN